MSRGPNPGGNPNWVKGKSANPGGRKPHTVDGIHIPTLARKYCPEAIRTLAEVMADKEAPHAARVRAAEALLDRGIGKAPAVVLMPQDQSLIPMEALTDEDLAAIISGGVPALEHGDPDEG